MQEQGVNSSSEANEVGNPSGNQVSGVTSTAKNQLTVGNQSQALNIDWTAVQAPYIVCGWILLANLIRIRRVI